MHHFDAISQKISGGGPPDPHLREGVTPSPILPLSALRASVKPSASFVPCAPPAVEVLDPPLGLAFVLMLRPFFPELVISTDLLSFEHLSILLFCSYK